MNFTIKNKENPAWHCKGCNSCAGGISPRLNEALDSIGTHVGVAVEKDGTLGMLELVSGADHKSLDTAALNAVKFGAPFPPLPKDFPEDRWVITCTFYYR